jgi:hypothetical protein
MPAPLFSREDERLAVSARGDEQVVTEDRPISPTEPPGAEQSLKIPQICLCEEKRATGQIEGLYGVSHSGFLGKGVPRTSSCSAGLMVISTLPSWRAP